MGFLDKLLGREKKDTGEMAGGTSAHDEGMHQEHEGMAEGAAPAGEEHATEAHGQGAEHEN
ncbi:MAG TPA: hypothetical protein VK488_14155 [Gaiellaceae bacterium]|jgi:hypothetical protein|nr:hypothetical protein [Gaiellaceae bacterium]